MVAYRRQRPDPVLTIAAITLCGIGVTIVGLAARIMLGAVTIPISIHEHDEEGD